MYYVDVAPYIFFVNDTATTEIYTLSLHDALPISAAAPRPLRRLPRAGRPDRRTGPVPADRPHAEVPRAGVQARPGGAGAIGRAHVCTPVTPIYRMPSSA